MSANLPSCGPLNTMSSSVYNMLPQQQHLPTALSAAKTAVTAIASTTASVGARAATAHLEVAKQGDFVAGASPRTPASGNYHSKSSSTAGPADTISGPKVYGQPSHTGSSSVSASHSAAAPSSTGTPSIVTSSSSTPSSATAAAPSQPLTVPHTQQLVPPGPASMETAVIGNPGAYSEGERARIQNLLSQKLQSSELQSRSNGSGGGKVYYIEGQKCFDIANMIFGFDGWSSAVTHNITTDFIENSTMGQDKVNIGVSAVVRVTLKNGSYHEDVGYGLAQNLKKGDGLEKAKKEAVTDARKRALRLFGPKLGNSVYDKEHIAKVKSGKEGTKGAAMEYADMLQATAPMVPPPVASTSRAGTGSSSTGGSLIGKRRYDEMSTGTSSPALSSTLASSHAVGASSSPKMLVSAPIPSAACSVSGSLYGGSSGSASTTTVQTEPLRTPGTGVPANSTAASSYSLSLLHSTNDKHSVYPSAYDAAISNGGRAHTSTFVATPVSVYGGTRAATTSHNGGTVYSSTDSAAVPANPAIASSVLRSDPSPYVAALTSASTSAYARVPGSSTASSPHKLAASGPFAKSDAVSVAPAAGPSVYGALASANSSTQRRGDVISLDGVVEFCESDFLSQPLQLNATTTISPVSARTASTVVTTGTNTNTSTSANNPPSSSGTSGGSNHNHNLNHNNINNSKAPGTGLPAVLSNTAPSPYASAVAPTMITAVSAAPAPAVGAHRHGGSSSVWSPGGGGGSTSFYGRKLT